MGKPEDLAVGKSLPCLRVIDIKIRKDRLANVYRMHFYIYFRVWNGYIAYMQNLGGLQLFKEWLIEQIGNSPTDGLPLEDGEMIVMSKSWNIREEMFDMSKELVGLK